MRRPKGDGWWNGNFAYMHRRNRQSGHEPSEVITEQKLTDEESAKYAFDRYVRVCAICDSVDQDWPLPLGIPFADPVSLVRAIESSRVYDDVRRQRQIQAKMRSSNSEGPDGALVERLKQVEKARRRRSKTKLKSPSDRFGTAGRVRRQIDFCVRLAGETSVTGRERLRQLHILAQVAGGRLVARGRYAFPDGTALLFKDWFDSY